VIRAVLDANVLVSGVISLSQPSSVPGEVLRRSLASEFAAITSDHILAEVERTLDKEFFRQILTDADRQDAVKAPREQLDIVQIIVPEPGVATHPEDDLVLATALSADCSYLVTGDRQLQNATDRSRQHRLAPAISRDSGQPEIWGLTDRSLCDKMQNVVASERHERHPQLRLRRPGKETQMAHNYTLAPNCVQAGSSGVSASMW
jgi:putative PIN family toxin of toxin-antitoxin system